MRKWKTNGKVTGNYDTAVEILKSLGERGINFVWKLSNIAFESGVVAED